MSILKVFLIIFFLFNLNTVKADNQEKINQITKNLRCLVCQGQSVYDSDSEFANSLKTLVKQRLDEGLSENQIYDYLKIKYGVRCFKDIDMVKV